MEPNDCICSVCGGFKVYLRSDEKRVCTWCLKNKLESIKKLTEPFIEWGGPQGTSYRVRLHKHPELQKYVSDLMKILYEDRKETRFNILKDEL